MSSDGFAEQQHSAFASALAGLKEGPEIQMQPGPNHVRILSRYRADGTREIEFWLAFVVHWNVGPNKRLVRCLRPEGQPCYVCEYVAQLSEAGHADAAQRMQASNRYLMAAVQMDIQKPVAKVLATGSQVLEGVLGFAVNESWGDPSDPVNGYGLVVSKQGSGLGTKYTVSADRNRTPVQPDWIKSMPDLTKHYRPASYNDQQQIMAGQAPSQQSAQPTGPVQAPPAAGPASVAPPPPGPAPAPPPPGPAPAPPPPGPAPAPPPPTVPVQAPPSPSVVGTPPPPFGVPVVTGGEAPTVEQTRSDKPDFTPEPPQSAPAPPAPAPAPPAPAPAPPAPAPPAPAPPDAPK